MLSAISGTPLLAAFLAILANILLMVLPMSAGLVRGPWRESAEWMLQKVNVQAHFYGSFLTGALDSAHIVFDETSGQQTPLPEGIRSIARTGR